MLLPRHTSSGSDQVRSLLISADIYIFMRLFCVCVVLGLELRAYSEPPPPALFVLSIFEIGSCKLFAQGWLQTVILLISTS
jgi:hypothetical protein